MWISTWEAEGSDASKLHIGGQAVNEGLQIGRRSIT